MSSRHAQDVHTESDICCCLCMHAVDHRLLGWIALKAHSRIRGWSPMEQSAAPVDMQFRICGVPAPTTWPCA